MQSVLIGIQKQRKFTLWADLRSVSVAAVSSRQRSIVAKAWAGAVAGILAGAFLRR